MSLFSHSGITKFIIYILWVVSIVIVGSDLEYFTTTELILLTIVYWLIDISYEIAMLRK